MKNLQIIVDANTGCKVIDVDTGEDITQNNHITKLSVHLNYSQPPVIKMELCPDTIEINGKFKVSCSKARLK